MPVMKPLAKTNPSGRPVSERRPFCPSTKMLRVVPGHTDGLIAACAMLTVGSGLTMTLTFAVLVQPVAVSVTVSV